MTLRAERLDEVSLGVHKLSVLVLIVAISSSTVLAQPECPLTWERPEPDRMFMAQIEPLEFLMASPTVSKCKGLLAALTNLRKQLIEFHEATSNPLPTNPSLERRQAADALSKNLVKMFFQASDLYQRGEVCEGKSDDESTRTAFVHLVRSIYAYNDNIRNIAGEIGSAIDLTDRVPKAFKRIVELIKAERALREEHFVKTACEELEKEFQRRCVAGSGATEHNASNALIADLQARLKKLHELQRTITGNKTLIDQIRTPLKSLGLRADGSPDRENPFSVEDSYYDSIVPDLKMCALQFALWQQPTKSWSSPFWTRSSKNGCEFFACKEEGLLYDPNLEEKPVAVDPVCAFMENYREMEASYLKGYQHYQKVKLEAERHPAKVLPTFCPPSDFLSTPAKGAHQK